MPHRKTRPSTKEWHDLGAARALQDQRRALLKAKKGKHGRKFRPQDEKRLQAIEEELARGDC